MEKSYRIEIYENIETGEYTITPQDNTLFDTEYTDDGWHAAKDIAYDIKTQLENEGYKNIIIVEL